MGLVIFVTKFYSTFLLLTHCYLYVAALFFCLCHFVCQMIRSSHMRCTAVFNDDGTLYMYMENWWSVLEGAFTALINDVHLTLYVYMYMSKLHNLLSRLRIWRKQYVLFLVWYAYDLQINKAWIRRLFRTIREAIDSFKFIMLMTHLSPGANSRTFLLLPRVDLIRRLPQANPLSIRLCTKYAIAQVC